MRFVAEPIAEGSLRDCDLNVFGARSGLFWRSEQTVLVGLGEHARIPVDRPGGATAAQAALSELGIPAFATLPFDPNKTGELIVPQVAILERAGERTVFFDAAQTTITAIVDEVSALLSAPAQPAPTEIELRCVRPPAEWRDDVVAAAIERIHKTELKKVVMARELVATAGTNFAIEPLLGSLIERFPTANLFTIDGFIGASPEQLVARSGRVVGAHPLAGTAARLADPEADAAQMAGLQASSKDRSEHRITIDWLLTELLPFCSYVDAEPEPSVMSMANVHHLATRVEGMLSEPAASILELVAAVHPTPALGGDPQGLALEVITELEGMDRGRYGGPTGWVDPDGNGEFAVSVRTTQLSGQIAQIWAGVGVVGASEPAAELAETQAKFQAILGSLLGSGLNK